jgi:hypothetical protein
MSKVEVVVHAGPHPRHQCPVVARLPLPGGERAGGVRLAAADGRELPAQVCPPHPFAREEAGSEQALIAFVVPELGTGEKLVLSAEWGEEARGDGEGVDVRDDGGGSVSVSVGGELITVYRYLDNPARPCFFPLLGPGGTRVTRSWPVADDVPGETRDHPHHRSMWVAHGDVNRTDNWSEAEGHGFQVHREITSIGCGPVLGWVAAVNDWTDREKRKVIEERRVLTAYAITGDQRMLDLDVCFAATECDVRFGDTKEGGILALRVAPAMDGDHGGRIENSYGAVGEGECWGRRAQWCDYSGEIAGQRLGIAILDHPDSFRHPTFWHVRDYGMYTANPFGWHDFYGDPAADGSHVLPRGARLYFHYRVYLHRGGAAEAAVAERYHDYAKRPRVEIDG